MPDKRVATDDGLSLAVHEDGDPARPTVVCVHGYPDNSSIWKGVAERLSERFHVVRYDVRGAGESDKPRSLRAYRLDRLVSDLEAVIEAVSPHHPVHLLAHDWGSIQSWHAVTGELSTRLSSFTSISGPCLDHAAHWMRSRLRPRPRALRELVSQLLRSGYIGFFHLAPLPELLWRTEFGRRIPERLEWLEHREAAADGTPARARRNLPDLLHGLKLYRANMRGRFTAPQRRWTDVPVQVLAPTSDAFVSVALQTDIAPWVRRLWVHEIAGGHWLPRNRPATVADHTARHIERVDPGAEAR
ncbi:pimeloyl-ACP methyl ester carboxylesterase [Halopolyspora algeriensis]|uniref:Pimeloyl-ACP methyl ester carboxylesterase n=1 Tax=Halopolyspora algeriensis TaxID=1500506 RepID=A0A368VLP9_9ACTN|nr:alpha/beta fold hydrolase [Halopolyspora algeriensis]RCW39945.1 pimeloyl-ACP methyl ester carboxylesterase [Halopolyspora algeriensis]TQM46618.1 pimeloyl-ACP methyl ester carboxylesterase [Halopolyspora algeriensis]